MQKSRASFTVFFEDPFWVGVYEREEPGGLTACRVVFGAEPKDGEIYEWMLQNWAQLHFGPPLADVRRPREENPKRARRMARRLLAGSGSAAVTAYRIDPSAPAAFVANSVSTPSSCMSHTG